MFCKTYNGLDLQKFRWESALYKAVDIHDVFSDYEWQSCMWMKIIKTYDMRDVVYYGFDEIVNYFTTVPNLPFMDCLDLLGCKENYLNKLIIFDEINRHTLCKDKLKTVLTCLAPHGIISFASNNCSLSKLKELEQIMTDLGFEQMDPNPQFIFLNSNEKLIVTFTKK